MSSELRLKKLRGSGGYVMAKINDEQQMKGNLGGPDLFLAPIGRLDKDIISKHFCNTCEKEFEDAPDIQYENPNEEVAENLVLAEKGQYVCGTCNSTIAEYRKFQKQDEATEIGSAKPEEETRSETIAPEEQLETISETIEPDTSHATIAEPAIQQTETIDTHIPEQTETIPDTIQTEPEEVTQPTSGASVSSIEGRPVYDENANKVGTAKQIGLDSNQSLVLSITSNDGTESSVPWDKIRKVGEIVLLGSATQTQNEPGKCPSCGFVNKAGSKFCEECGNKLE